MLCFKLLALVIWLMGFAYGQLVLPPDELKTLEEIARTLGKTDWDFSKNANPCSGLSPWVTQSGGEYKNEVRCDCNNTSCHVNIISLKGQNLTGSLPRELSRLPFLQKIDLTRNYLSGPIPPDWASLNLTHIALVGNRITGSLPKELANIPTLQNLTLDFNQLSGPIPPEFGNFRLIERLFLTSNNLTGELPENLSNLVTLTDFRINDNNLRGSIPNFIQKWVNIKRLDIQASGLSGPIPSSIASLTSLTDLRISDLNGDNESNLTFLSSLTNLDTLILRNCKITGELPDSIGNMRRLDVLDLSFNKLTGSIPSNFGGLSKTDYIYLTGNSLTGDQSTWMLGNRLDLSYNNLKSENLPDNCPGDGPNLFASSRGNTPATFSCLPKTCENEYYYFHINCGGSEKQVGEYKYEDDTNPGGKSTMFLQRGSNWGFSSTGHFLNDARSSKTYITKSNNLTLSESIYMDARISPLSLTYFGFCLINGNYSVKLHFAEIMFTTGATYGSLGRRIFDVYIQGVLVQPDFNIENKAGGVNKEYVYNFTALVTNHTMEIRFYWAGKGTTGIPTRGVYGPLISAISVINPDYTPPGNNISAGAIVGIVIAALFTVFLVLGILRYLKRKGSTTRYDLKGVDLHTGSFSLRQIKAATNNFDPANKIGEGGFGPVYKGVLLDGTIIAVKQLSSKSQQGNREFVNEIGMISALQHPHLVKLYGCCIESNQLLLVYEYLENNSLARALFGPEEQQLHLDWATRHMICIGIARGLAYLHEESRLKIVHRDIKATNVLLDKDFVPKISDFGLAKLDDEDNTHISTRIAGTFGYMAPEYAMRGYLTDKADVYSFGVVLLEVVSGRSNTSIRPKEERFYLLDWANSLKAKGDVMELVDPRLGSEFNREEVTKAINVALLCTNPEAVERPSMSAVVSVLVGEGAAGVAHFDKMATMEFESISMDVPWTASSASTSDLYPITMNTEYWEKRDL